MIDVKEAAEIAVRYVQSLPMMPADAIRLEEVVLDDDEKTWLITLSFIDKSDIGVWPLEMGPPSRLYKMLKIDAEDGEVHSMLIRKLASA